MVWNLFFTFKYPFTTPLPCTDELTRHLLPFVTVYYFGKSHFIDFLSKQHFLLYLYQLSFFLALLDQIS